MLDPLSAAAGVAALVALAGTTSKLFYQFFRSIHDAPAVARDLVSALYTLNIALSQIQGSLLNQNFVSIAEDNQLEAIQESLTSCTAAFGNVKAKVDASGLAFANQQAVKKAWSSVKASFNEDQMRNCLQRIEQEKTTLLLIVDIFSARLSAGIMGQVLENKALVQKQDRRLENMERNFEKAGRRLKNLNIFAEWVVNHGSSSRHTSSSSPSESVETTAFSLSSAYEAEEIGNLLKSSGSVLSLTLGDLEEGSVGAVWEPEPESTVPLRRVVSTLQAGRPPTDDQGLFESRSRVVQSSSAQFDESMCTLKRQYMPTQGGAKFLSNGLSAFGGVSSLAFGMINLEHVLVMAQRARDLNNEVYNDLQYAERSYTALSKHWVIEHEVHDDRLLPQLAKMNAAIANYMNWAGTVMQEKEGSKKRLQHDIRTILKAGPNEAERKRLRSELVGAVEEVRDAQATLASAKLYDMQREQLALQNQMTEELRLLVRGREVEPEAQSPPTPGSRDFA